jgi:hypothetical protein
VNGVVVMWGERELVCAVLGGCLCFIGDGRRVRVASENESSKNEVQYINDGEEEEDEILVGVLSIVKGKSKREKKKVWKGISRE